MTFWKHAARTLAWYLVVAAIFFGPTIAHVLTAEAKLGTIPVRRNLTPAQRILYLREEVLGTVKVNIYPYDAERGMGGGNGTGGVFTNDGYILTAAHVVEDKEYVYVTFHQLDRMAIGFDELRMEPADVLAISHQRDMAIIKLRHPERVHLTVLTLDPEDKTLKGSPFWFIGCTTGLRGGVVMSADTTTRVGSPTDVSVMRHITIGATLVDHGDSGGPAFDADGNVIGVIIAGNASDVGVITPLRNGFAELLAKAQAKAKQLAKK
jgi:serine protease Do